MDNQLVIIDEEKIEQRRMIFQNWLNNKCRFLMMENELDYLERTHFEDLFPKYHPFEVIQYYQDTGILWPKNSFNDNRFESLMAERDRCWNLYRFYDDLFYENLPNLKPDNYIIINSLQIGKYLLIKIKYLYCTNYESRKILVFKNTLKKLKSQKLIDPHFSDNKNFISPIARFEPTI